LTIYPAIRRDATASNWIRKRDIYADSRLYVATPSMQLMRNVEQSMLAPAVTQALVIPNGVDLSVFRPADKQSARNRLDIAPDVPVVLLTVGRRTNPWRDHLTLRAAIESSAGRLSGRNVLVVAVGDETAALGIAGMTMRFVTESDPETMALHYQAADVYVHAARADTFPISILEALACGTPVVATAVGGIPEQIQALEAGAGGSQAPDQLTHATGVLVPVGNPEAMADAIVALLIDRALRDRLGDNATRDAGNRFDLNRQVESYLSWYRTIIDHWNWHAKSDCETTPLGAAGQNRLAVD
jgi:glycosyltransferase involved in cell wall biosynthesis